MTTAKDWIQKKLDSGELSAQHIADLTEAFQRQNALRPPDAKPGPQALGRASTLLAYYRDHDTPAPPPPPPPVEPEPIDDELPNLSLDPDEWVPGIDVSHHQSLDGDELDGFELDGFEFAFVKASEGTSGAGSVDSKMVSHLQELQDVVEPLGIYHFARPSSAVLFGPTAGQPLGEAQNFARQWERAVGAVGTLLPPVLDIEDEKPQIPEPTKLIDWCAEWCEHCERLTGRRPIIYTYFSYIHVQLKGVAKTLGAYPLWMADYRADPPNSPREIPDWPWLFWQHSGNGRVPGVSGACDLNVFRGTFDQLRGLIR